MTTVFKNMDKILILKSDERFGEDSLLLAWQYLRHSVWRVLPPLLFGNTKATFSQATLVRLVNGHWKEVGEASCSPSEFFVRSASVPLCTPDTHSQTSTTEMPRSKKRLLENNPLLQSSVLSPGLFSHSLFSPVESLRPTRVFWDFAERQTYARNCEDPWLEESAVNKKSVYFFRSFISRPEIGHYSQSTPIFSFPVLFRNFTLIK